VSAIVTAPAAGRLSSGFGWRTLGGEPNLHTGVDIAGARGSAIYAVLDGEVIAAGNISGYGTTVVLEHPDEQLYSLYAHLDRSHLRRGQVVRAGQRIGAMGGSGWRPNEPNRTVPVHLHFEFLDAWPPSGKDENRLDPIATFARLGLSLDDAPGSLFSVAPAAVGSGWLAQAVHRVIQPYPWG
jgi:murein DD-endopeptidase MepM/ murein hydrolase activator NlpD